MITFGEGGARSFEALALQSTQKVHYNEFNGGVRHS